LILPFGHIWVTATQKSSPFTCAQYYKSIQTLAGKFIAAIKKNKSERSRFPFMKARKDFREIDLAQNKINNINLHTFYDESHKCAVERWIFFVLLFGIGF